MPTGDPCWLATAPEPIFAVLHAPASGPSSRMAALILPAFGWDNECSYRRRRDWAVRLAESGITAARIDLPGSEASAGSPLAADRFESWVSAAEEAAWWLRERAGCERLAAIGLGLGGLIAYLAAARGAPIDDLLLWGVRSSGRAIVRELRTYAAVTAGEDGEPAAATENGALGIGGHVMSAETATALSEVDLTETALSQAGLRRVMLVARDAHGIDRRLQEHLLASGAAVTVLDSDEYGRMISPPDLVLAPTATVAASIEWLRDGLECRPLAHPADSSPPDESTAVSFEHDGVQICERLVAFQSSSGRLVGVISEPSGARRAPFCLVTVNSGALRNTGPNRMFVEIARRAAAAGVPAARIDLPGLGDSDGVAIKSFERRIEDEAGSLATLGEIYDHLAQLGVADRFVAGGFSLGGYLTVRAALSDPRVVGAISVNPTGFSWTVKQRQRAIRDFTAMAGPEALAPAGERRMASGGPPAARARGAWRRRRLEAQARHHLARVEILWRLEHRRELSGLRRGLDQLSGSETRMVLLLSDGEQLLRMLDRRRLAGRLAACPNLVVERLPGDDHLLRPLWVQKVVIDRFISALIELQATPCPPTATPVDSAG